MTRYFFVFMLFITLNSWAEGPNDYLCLSHDQAKNYWQSRSPYQRVATQRALELCKKESTRPISCIATLESCHYIGEDPPQEMASADDNGNWQCTALDQNATPWAGKPSLSRDEAALSAEGACHSHSPLPETCYLNFTTCVRQA